MSGFKPTDIDPEKLNNAMKTRLKPITKEESNRMLEEGFARGNREEPDNLELDDELRKLRKG
jgi:hypothetical protein